MKRVLLEEVRQALNEAASECLIFVSCEGEYGGGHFVCAFCGYKSLHGDHFESCLSSRLEELSDRLE